MFKIMYSKEKHCLLALCDTLEGAQRWIDNFNPSIWMNKNMSKEDFIIVKN